MTLDVKRLSPRGFRILTRQDLRVPGLPPTFNERQAGESKAGWGNGVHFILEMANLRITRFAAVGALGTVVNLLVMALLLHGLFGINYLVAAVVAAEVSILHNFMLQERFVFRDMQNGVSSRRNRLTQHLLFNNAEALVRLPFLVLLVETMHVWALLAQAVTLAIAFVARFLFASRVLYRPKPVGRHRAPRNRAEEFSA